MNPASRNPDYRFRVEVCYTPAQYPLYAQDMGIVVVIDILRATSAMVAAFEHGCERIIPVSTVEEARQYLGREGHIVGAERNGEVVEGFQYGNSPLAFRGPEVAGKTLMMTTTNGTRTIELAQSAKRMVIGAFLNLTALSDWLVKQDGEGKVSINGRDPRLERTAVLGNIGFVPQLPPPLKMPVAQLIDFSAALCGTDPARIHELAQRLGLDLAPILTRPFVKLSGGMK